MPTERDARAVNQADLLGVWLLDSFDFEDTQTGKRWEPFGKNPSGTVIIHPEGRFIGVVAPSMRTDPRTDTEKAAAFRKLIAYSGRYRLEPPNRLITKVDVAWMSSWVGGEQTRFATLEDNRLRLVTTPLKSQSSEDGSSVVGTLWWSREKP